MHCRFCDTALPDDVSFCPNCGARVPDPLTSSAGQPTTNLPAGAFQLPPAVAPAGTPGRPVQIAAAQSASDIPQGVLPPAVYVEAVPNSNSATVSLIFGILSWFLLPLIGAIVAIVAGHMARREIRDSGGRISGSGMATAGLILGYVHLALLVIAGCAVVLFLIFGIALISTNS